MMLDAKCSPKGCARDKKNTPLEVAGTSMKLCGGHVGHHIVDVVDVGSPPFPPVKMLGLNRVGVTPTLPMSHPRCHMNLAKSGRMGNHQILGTFKKFHNDVNGNL